MQKHPGEWQRRRTGPDAADAQCDRDDYTLGGVIRVGDRHMPTVRLVGCQTAWVGGHCDRSRIAAGGNRPAGCAQLEPANIHAGSPIQGAAAGIADADLGRLGRCCARVHLPADQSRSGGQRGSGQIQIIIHIDGDGNCGSLADAVGGCQGDDVAAHRQIVQGEQRPAAQCQSAAPPDQPAAIYCAVLGVESHAAKVHQLPVVHRGIHRRRQDVRLGRFVRHTEGWAVSEGGVNAVRSSYAQDSRAAAAQAGAIELGAVPGYAQRYRLVSSAVIATVSDVEAQWVAVRIAGAPAQGNNSTDRVGRALKSDIAHHGWVGADRPARQHQAVAVAQ